MKTKLLALFLAMIMVVSMLAACGDDTPDDPTPDGPGTGDNGGNNGGNQGGGNQGGGDEDDLPNYEWDVTDLIFELTENSNAKELTSQVKRYLAGEEEDCFDSIDTAVAERNAAAYDVAKVNVTYKYLPDTDMYRWSKNAALIETSVQSMSSDTPDIFCNFVYDMVNASLKSCFANLFSTSRGVDELAGANYFAFLSHDQDTEYKDTGDGYMIEYMKSLSLSKHKMYCLSSDYFVDMVRAFFVVPVNNNLINKIEVAKDANKQLVDGQFNSDRTGDGEFTIDDFYELVWDGEWNYETLAQFCQVAAVDSDNAASGVTWNLADTIGFAISGSSGLSASGMLYTTSIKIIYSEWDDIDDPDGPGEEPGDGNDIYLDYRYYYNPTAEDLTNFCNNLNTLFKSNGVISVADADTLGYGESSLVAIRNRFSDDKVLFGGVICLGSLEDDVYQEMIDPENPGSGFGIVPVPLYRTNYVDPEDGQTKVDPYLTQIHNIGRIGAIAHCTYKFAQCSAFLNYQSLNSTDILNDYYEFKLQYDVGGGSEGNIEMLDYIRENVRSSFDKAFEDAIGKFFVTTDTESNDKKWHTMILMAGYQMTDMATKYDGLYEQKEQRLQSLRAEYDGLPD